MSKDWKVFRESKMFTKELISGIELTKGSKQNQKTFVKMCESPLTVIQQSSPLRRFRDYIAGNVHNVHSETWELVSTVPLEQI